MEIIFRFLMSSFVKSEGCIWCLLNFIYFEKYLLWIRFFRCEVLKNESNILFLDSLKCNKGEEGISRL